MAHFAKLGANGKVIAVLTLDNKDMLNADGVEDACVDVLPSVRPSVRPSSIRPSVGPFAWCLQNGSFQ